MQKIRITVSLFMLSALMIGGGGALAQPDAPPLPTCTTEELATAVLSPYSPTRMQEFVRVVDDRLFVLDEEYTVRGVNYYPSRYPWRRFLTETNLEEIPDELRLIADTGMNTLRIFLWNEALFICPGSGAVPNVENFLRLDAIIHEAARQGLRLIVTLNDIPDLEEYPLYTNPAHTQLQTRYILQRYRDEAAILAWDVRNAGNTDYSEQTPEEERFPRDQVVNWLAGTVAQVRMLAPNHLTTAGWLDDSEATIPYVDIVSFGHRGDSGGLQARVNQLRNETDKPLLLAYFGYDTATFSGDQQASAIYADVTTVEEAGAVGWLIWTAFDFPLNATCVEPDCPSEDTFEHYFGLWRIDYRPKPAAGVLADLFGAEG